MLLIFIKSFIITFFMNLSNIHAFIKIRRLEKSQKIHLLLLTNVIIGVLHTVIYLNITQYFEPMFINVICYILDFYLLILLIDGLDSKFIITMLLAMGFALLAFSVAAMILFIIIKLLGLDMNVDNIIIYFMVGIIQLILIHYIFRIKRFKNGFAFIQENTCSISISKINVILMIIIIAFLLLSINRDTTFNRTISKIIILLMILTFYLIQQSITKHYKLKMKDRTMEIFNEKLNAKDNEIKELKEELENVLKINHKYNHRISAMEKAVANLKFNSEVAKEHGEIIELVNNLSKEYKEELNKTISKESVHKTGIFGIDNLIEYMYKECEKNNIKFVIEINTSVKDLIGSCINQNQLETMLGDHIMDSIIAINFAKDSGRKIKLEFNKQDDIYEVLFYDTGIEFKIDTLLKLGLEKITTHKETRRKRNWIYDNI